jgi:acylglycerol lipase
MDNPLEKNSSSNVCHEDLFSQTSTQIHPLLEKLRTHPRCGYGENGFFMTRTNFRLFYRKMLPGTSEKIEKVVLCIHGLHSHGEKFILLADHFVKYNWATYALDLRGHGLSWTTPEQRGDVDNYQDWVDDVLEFMEYLHGQYPEVPIYIIAESMGAGLSVHVAISHPPGLQGLIFISPALKPIPQVKLSLALRTITYGQFAPDKQVIRNRGKGVLVSNTEVYQQYQLEDPLRLTQLTPRYYFQVLSMLAKLKSFDYNSFYPVMVFYGEDDHMIDFRAIKEFILRVNNKDKSLHYIPNAFHEMLTDFQAVRYGLYKKITAWIHLH